MSKQDGDPMTPDLDKADGGCRFGAVRFHVKLKGGLGSARRCNCSMRRTR
jgi:hypothetical protein